MTPVWSGGVAFSYFPAESAQGQFGMVTISANGMNVSTSADFAALQAQYNNVSFINSPLQSTATYPSCTSAAELSISTTLPPTPNEAACNCLENNLSCQFTPKNNNDSVIVGVLLDFACGLLGPVGESCNDISANGSTGVYGPIAGCDPGTSSCMLLLFCILSIHLETKLSYVMSEYFEKNGNNVQSCSFGGNGTINGHSTASATAAASSCIADPSATFTPNTTTPHLVVSQAGSLDVTVGMAMVGVMGVVWTLV